MLKQFLHRMIYGVSEMPEIADEKQRQFLCETELSMDEIHGAEADGTLQPWRTDPDGFQWYRRVNGADSLPIIHGLDADDDDEYQDPFLYEPTTSSADAVRNYHLRQVERKLRERHAAFPINEDFDSEGDDDE